ncbi:MAG: ATP-binding protein [Candidatus Magasanikbacteria bacterium]|nr:ATP-binding protein [Candidatus Magasanikbacteria bacterium]
MDKKVMSETNSSPLFFIGDDIQAQKLLSRNELNSLKEIIGDNKLLVIDEAQKIENIGLSLKLIVDNLPVMIVASGSSSFDLANKLNEPLTGRTATLWLYPLSYQEVHKKYRLDSKDIVMEEILRFGMFPKVHSISGTREKEDYLYEYLNNYLYKDILILENIKKPKKILDLLALLAFQIGRQVSIAELARNLQITQVTVEKYLNALEKMFVLINLRGFSRNLRKEITKTSKYYFMDLGLRNALIRNFNPLGLRSDAGELFENWFIVERIKAISNSGKHANFYFWRTYDQKEVDLVEERDGKLFGYECKWSVNKTPKPPKEWLGNYSNASYQIVNRDNFEKSLL